MRVTLYRLRQALQESADGPVLHITRETVQFNPESDCRIDVFDFASHLAQRHLEAALEVYQGELLAELTSGSDRFEEWLEVHG